MSDMISKTSDATVSLSFSEAIEHLCEHIRQGIESCIPAQFIKYDNRDKNLAVVSPLVKFPYVSGNKTVWKDRPHFTVRVIRVKSGGFWFEMPLKNGDTGWIIAADRDSSYAIERNSSIDTSKNAGQQTYGNFNKLKYAFGFFIPDGFCNLSVKEGHEGSSLWTKLKDDGSGESKSWIELCEDGKIVLHAEGETEDGSLMEWKKVLVEGFLEVNKNVDIDGTVVAEKKNADGTDNDDPVEIKNTEYLIPIDKDKNLYAIWKGRSFRNGGKTSEPFKLTGSGSIEGKLIKEVRYRTTEEGVLITFIYTDDTQDTFLVPRGPQGDPGTGGLTTIFQGGGISVTGNPTYGYTIENALVLTPGTDISITGNAADGYTISFTGSSGETYTAGSGISISNKNVISAHWE